MEQKSLVEAVPMGIPVMQILTSVFACQRELLATLNISVALWITGAEQTSLVGTVPMGIPVM